VTNTSNELIICCTSD